MDLYVFTDHEGIERVVRCHNINRAQVAAYTFVLGQTNSLAAAAVALRTARKAEEAS